MSFICSPASTDEITKKLKEAKEANIASAFSGTGIPALDSILAGLTEALGGLAAAGVTTAITAMQDELEDELGLFVSSALAGVTAVLNMGTEVQALMFGLAFDSLKRQVKLRQISLTEAKFHVEGILNILNRLNRSYEQNFDTRLRNAYPYIRAAYENVTVLRNAMKSANPRFNVSLLRTAVQNIDVATGILTGDKSRALGQKFFQNVVKDPGKAFRDFIFEAVLAEYIIMSETYIWHITNLASIVIGGGTPVGFGTVDLTFGNNIAGVPSDRQTMLKQRQEQYNKLRRDLYKEINPNGASALQKLVALDLNKGLILTHETVKTSVSVAKNFKTNWNTLSASATALWVTLSPAHGILKDINDKVKTHLDNNTSGRGTTGFTKTVAEPLFFRTWVVAGLESAKQMLLMQAQAGEGFDKVAQDLAVIDSIIAYLNSEQYDKNSEQTLDLMLKFAAQAATYALTGPLSKSVLRRTIVLFTEINKLLDTALIEETTLLSLLQQLNIMDNPVTAAAQQALAGIAAQSPLGATLVGGLVSGQWTAVASVLTNVASAVGAGAGVVSDLFKKLTGQCNNTNTKTAATNEKANEQMRVQEDLVKKTATANENKVEAPEYWWEGNKGSSVDFHQGLTL